MAGTLVAACLALANKSVGLMTGLISHNYPPAAGFTPFSVTYPDEGDMDSEQIPATRGLHYIISEIHVSATDLALAIERTIPMVEAFCKAVLADPTLGGACDTVVGPITYKFGRLSWGGKQDEHIGIRFRVQVKIRQVS